MMLLQEHDLQWGGQQGDPCPDFFMYAGFLPRLVTFREANVRGFLFMERLHQGGLDTERSLWLGVLL